MKITAIAALAVCALGLSGCATAMRGTSESIAVTTQPVEGAYCMLANGRGTWRVNATPANVRVSRSRKALRIVCTKPGYQDARLRVPSEFEVWTLGNLLIGGLVGLTVDASDGAMNNYPNVIFVPMQPVGPTPGQPAYQPPPVSPAQDIPAPTAFQ